MRRSETIMTTLTQLAGAKPSALAVFAVTPEGRARPLATPLKPLKLPTGGAPQRGVSGLETFAKSAASLEEKEAALPARRPEPLSLRAIASPKKEEDAKADGSRSEEHTNGGDQHTDLTSESSVQQEKQQKADEKEAAKSIDAPCDKQSDDESEACDSMAEFACTESSEAIEIAPPIDADLYDQYEAAGRQDGRTRSWERMFVPQTSEEELLDAILSSNVPLLSHLLSKLTPPEALGIRDTELRTIYHYAALSRVRDIQAVIFNFVDCYYSQDLFYETTAVKTKQRRLNQRLALTHHTHQAGSEWRAPRVEELKLNKEKKSMGAYSAAIQACDRYGRSFLHYSAINHTVFLLRGSPALRAVLKSNPSVLLQKDSFDRNPLTYAAMSDNHSLMDCWFDELGLGMVLNFEEVKQLSGHQLSCTTQELLFKQLERVDDARIQTKSAATKKCSGLSIHFLTNVQTSGMDILKRERIKGFRMRTTLHKAAIYGNEEGLEYLLDHGADVNEQDSNGWTPLHHCVEGGTIAHLAIAKLLLQNGCKINAQSLLGRTPLHILAMKGSTTTNSSSAEEHRDSLASMFGTLLWTNGAELEVYDNDHYTPFLAAVRSGNLQVTRILLVSGCDRYAIDTKGGCALHIAVGQSMEKMIQFLSWWDAEAPSWRDWRDYQGRTPKALAKNDNVRLALDNLWSAVHSRDIDQVKHQIRYSRSRSNEETAWSRYVGVLDKTPMTHRTALHLAIEACKTRLSMQRFNLKDSAQNSSEIIATLLAAGAKVVEGDQWGVTPLMISATLDSSSEIETLLKFATTEDLARTDVNGNTALHYSYAFSRAKISSIIEAFATGAEIKNAEGKLPLETTGMRERLFPSGYQQFLKQVMNHARLLSARASRK